VLLNIGADITALHSPLKLSWSLIGQLTFSRKPQ